MGTVQLEEDPDSMKMMNELPLDLNNELPLEDRSGSKPRLHLRDVTSESMSEDSETVGSELRRARMRRGEDLNSIALSLRIRRGQLEALEESRPEDLPGRAYAVGFIRSYAEYLGLDPAHIVERYKAELDGNREIGAEFSFPKVSAYRQLPRGTFLFIGVIIAVGIYGAWLLVQSADRMVAERVPAVPAQIAASGADAPDQQVRSLSGDPASAATRPFQTVQPQPNAVYAVAPALTPQAPSIAASPVTGVPADQAPAGQAPASQDHVALAQPSPQAMSVPAEAAAVNVAQALPTLPAGQTFGSENIDGRVVVLARKMDAWLRVEDGQGHVLIERTLRQGDSYRAPAAAGVIMVARDASAFEIMVDGASLGLAGPPTLVLTGKQLDAASLLAAMPRPAPALAETAPVSPVPATAQPAAAQ